MGLYDIAKRLSGTAANMQIERFCRELGWSIDHRIGQALGFDFRGDAISPTRTLYVAQAENAGIMSFNCGCCSDIPARRLPDTLLPSLLAHNNDVTIGGWVARPRDNSVALVLQYVAFSGGLDAATFKAICSLMISEVAETEGKLHQMGLL